LNATRRLNAATRCYLCSYHPRVVFLRPTRQRAACAPLSREIWALLSVRDTTR
jgi:hypothetical protein